MPIDEEFLREMMEKGWRCLNFGEHVPDSCSFTDDGNIECGGICQSDVCRQLPPGGNPFYVVIE